jgi:bifunctional non-homologous end joining protein LigD
MKAVLTSPNYRPNSPQGSRTGSLFYAFDLLWRDGDLRKLPQLKRKQMQADLLGDEDVDLPVIYSEHLTGDGQEMLEHAAKLNWEIKTVMKGKFPVIGFVKDLTGVAALDLGKREGKT